VDYCPYRHPSVLELANTQRRLQEVLRTNHKEGGILGVMMKLKTPMKVLLCGGGY